MRKILLLPALLITCLFPVHATVHYVNLNAVGANNGSNWTDAYSDFQTAIDNAASGDSVFVAQATYQPASGGSFIMKEGVKIFGGFLGAETDFSQRNLANKATLQSNGNSVIFNNGNGLTTDAVLDGFIVTGGNTANGGGMYNEDVSPAIRNCIFSGNSVTGFGGGMLNYDASPVISYCTFSGNTGIYGGGMANQSSDPNTPAVPIITGCIFSGNTTIGTSAGGGGMLNFATDPIITNSIFSDNNAAGNANNGGGMSNFYQASPTIINCVFWNNTANNGGGGLFNYTASNPIITNCIIGNNTAGVTSPGIFNESNSTPVITYSDVQDGLAAGTGNIYADPLFTDAANGDYTLQSGSPCINTGTPDTTGLHVGNTDLAGNARVSGSAIDMGAYEFSATLPVMLTSFTGTLQKNIASLQWQTGVEDNFNYFELQEGTDGKAFSTVATLNAKGNNSHYTANVPQAESKAYYRLKMVDNDGTFKYSGVVTLSQNTSSNTITVYPNPAKDYIHVNVANAGNIRIYTVSGVLVKAVQLQTGLNKIDIHTLGAGTYFIVSGNKTIKFIKQ